MKIHLSLLTTYLDPRDRFKAFTVEKEIFIETGSKWEKRKFIEEEIETIEEKIKRKHKILTRGCSMFRSLVEMSENGTSFENLILWHERIHNLSHSIAADNRNCYPPLQTPGMNLMFYKVSTSTSR